MATLGDVVLFLKANSEGLNKGLNDAETKTTGWASGLGSKIGPLIGGAVVGGVTLAVGALAGMGKAAFDVSNEVDVATKKMQAALFVTGEEADKLGDVAVGVFKNNFAGSITEAAEAVTLVKQQLGDLVDATELQGITEDAFRLADTFDAAIPDSISTAKTLMQTFGITSDKAFDLITAGYQSGLDRSGDFLDTINEYSTQFSSGGASVEQFFGLLQSGLAGGALGTDKAADAFKEFRVRIQDGSSATADALAAIGIDAEAMQEQFATGGITAAQAFDQVLDALNRTDDANVRMQAGVGLLGTQFEDLGDAALGLELMPDMFEDITGAAAGLDAQYNTLGAAVEGFKRQFLVAMIPVGDKLLEVANDIMPQVQGAFDWMANHLPGIVNSAAQALGEMVTGMLASFATLQLELARFRIRWVNDWGGMKTDTVRNWIELQIQAELFWTRLKTVFGDAEEDIKGGQDGFWKDITDNAIHYLNIILEKTELILRYWNQSWAQVQRFVTGDWIGFWQNAQAIQETEGQIMGNWIESMFGPDMRASFEAALDNVSAGIRGWWDGVVAWWGTLRLPSLFGGDTGGIPGLASGTSFARGGLAIVGERGPELVNLPRGSQVFSNSESSRMLTGDINIYQTIGAGVDGETVRQASRNGVLDAMRASGMK